MLIKAKSKDIHEIIEIINESAKSGEPVLRNLEYSYPHNGYAEIKDEFLCGDNILVCPVVTKGTLQKEIVFPEGRWVDVDGNVYTEGRHTVQTPINKLTWFRRAEK